jgi:hypothetical protein
MAAQPGAMKRIPEAQCLEAARGGAGELERHLDRVAAAGGEQHLAGRAGERLEARAERLGQFHRRLAGVAAWREAQLVELLLDRGDHVRMRIADVVHVVAVKIHVAPAGHVLDPDALGAADRVQARRRHRLVQERGAVAVEQGARGHVEVVRLPARAACRQVDVAFGLGRDGGRWGSHLFRRQPAGGSIGIRRQRCLASHKAAV